MNEYWENRFRNEGVLWKWEPSDSAKLALDLFNANKVHNILIPGFGYGRNAKFFMENGLTVTGIEISQSAIELAMAYGLNCTVHHGSVASMPFDQQQFDGIFCFAMIHLLNEKERRTFLKACYQQLKEEGLMVFVVASTQMKMYGNGTYISKDRYAYSEGLNVFFYNDQAVTDEFSDYGLVQCSDIEEHAKYMSGYEPMKMKMVVCKKMK